MPDYVPPKKLPEFDSPSITQWRLANNAYPPITEPPTECDLTGESTTPTTPTTPGEYERQPCFCKICIEKKLEKDYWTIWNAPNE